MATSSQSIDSSQPLTIRRHALFDFGGPLLKTPFELNEYAAASMGLPIESFSRGPFDPASDPRWQAWQNEEITEREFWVERAAPLGLDIPGYMRHFYEPSGNHLIRPETAAIVSEVQAAGFQAGLLTNDLSAFHGPEWRDPIDVLKLVDPLVDLSMTGYLKPHPEAYARAIKAMGVPGDEIVFIDDQPYNVQGAIDAGIHGVFFDQTDVPGTVARFRAALAGGS
jgi:putative hydrolase of the HAD superfamily